MLTFSSLFEKHYLPPTTQQDLLGTELLTWSSSNLSRRSVILCCMSLISTVWSKWTSAATAVVVLGRWIIIVWLLPLTSWLLLSCWSATQMTGISEWGEMSAETNKCLCVNESQVCTCSWLCSGVWDFESKGVDIGSLNQNQKIHLSILHMSTFFCCKIYLFKNF